ncbi:MAG: elongation factor Ts [Actinobacteria bacterium]|nr:elongation factor Ts [Actinomycetota bacterium]
MSYSAADVRRLREATAAGMVDCKRALVESAGDFDKAVEIIRVKGLKGVTKREGRATSNGLIAAKSEGDTSVMLELDCETDFVAKGERFQAVANELLEHLFVSKQKDLAAFLASKLATGKAVQELIDEANATMGEKVELRRLAVIQGTANAQYLHRTSPDLPPQVGVLVALARADAVIGKDIAQHIAAFAPQYLDRASVPSEAIDHERKVAQETAKNEGKPEEAIAKITEGRVTGFIKEVALLEQAYAKDLKRSVAAVLSEAQNSVSAFYRFRVGQ